MKYQVTLIMESDENQERLRTRRYSLTMNLLEVINKYVALARLLEIEVEPLEKGHE